jgi:hypothetical protein
MVHGVGVTVSGLCFGTQRIFNPSRCQPNVGGALIDEAASYGGVTKPVLRLGWRYGLRPWIAERAILGAVGFSFGWLLKLCERALRRELGFRC